MFGPSMRKVVEEVRRNYGNVSPSRFLTTTQEAITEENIALAKIDFDSEDGDALYCLGYEYAIRDNHTRALECYRRALSLSESCEETSRSYILISICEELKKLRRFSEASEVHTQYMEEFDPEGNELFEHAQLLRRAGDDDGAYEIYRELIDSGKDRNAGVYQMLCDIHERHGTPEAIPVLCAEMIQNNPLSLPAQITYKIFMGQDP